MIKLHKTAEPNVLTLNAAAWTKTLQEKLAKHEQPTNAEKTRYRHPDIKRALVAETGGKCAYCESPLLHIHHGDVEHIFPKSLDAAKTFEWANLTLACEICNQNKSDKDPYLAHIIDPYAQDPEAHLKFAGTFVFSMGSVDGQSTTILLDLNRAELLEQRKERLEKLLLIVESALTPNIPSVVKEAIIQDFKMQATSPGAPYAAMGRSFYTLIEAKLAA